MISQQIAPYFQTLLQTGLEPFRAFRRRKCVSHNVTGGLRNARLAKSCPILSICDLRARLARPVSSVQSVPSEAALSPPPWETCVKCRDKDSAADLIAIRFGLLDRQGKRQLSQSSENFQFEPSWTFAKCNGLRRCTSTSGCAAAAASSPPWLCFLSIHFP